MRTQRRIDRSFVKLALALAALSGACTPPADSELAGREPEAVNAAVNGMIALSQAVYAAQNGALPLADNQQAIRGDVTIGTCPVVTTAIVLDDQLAVDMSIDFGDGCEPFGTDAYVCSGSASGTFNQANRRIELAFDAFSCGNQTLTGTSGVLYSLSTHLVAVAGNWDLTYANDDEVFSTTGAGSGEYNRDAAQTTISTFSGTVSDESGLWAVQVTDVVVALRNDVTLLPFSGEVSLSGMDIRTIVVRFDENTPITGLIRVSHDSGAFFLVDLRTMLTVVANDGDGD